MKNLIKYALGTILAMSMGVAQANTLNGTLGIVGPGVDITPTNLTFGSGLGPYNVLALSGTGDFAPFDLSFGLGSIQDATTSAPVAGFLDITNGFGFIFPGSSSFTFDLITLSLTADTASATGIGTLTDASGSHSSNMVFTLTTQAGNTWSAGVSDVPEPTTLAMFGLGLIGLGFAKRKKA